MDGLVDSSMGIEPFPGVGPVEAAASADDAVVAAARAGDREAFGRLYERFGPMVHGVLLTRVPHTEVDDLVQDVFLAAFQRLSTLRAPGAFGGWLAAIARNRAIDYHRRSVAEQMTDDVPDGVVRPEAEALAVLAVIQSLPPAYRETLVLRLVEGMTGDEISRRTGLTTASVRVNLHRGMKRLREALESKRGRP
jgi:RNA polymerase sigma-70 factor (ECF subfamily)